jgi:hypothetical protein
MIPHGVEIFVCLEPIDLRWSFDRLSNLATARVGREARCGALFVFFGRRQDALKLLFFDGTGMCQFYNQLSSHCTSFVSRSGFWPLGLRITNGSRAVGESIPPAAMLLWRARRLLVEPSVSAVGVRLDDAVLDPAHERVLMDVESDCHLLLREQATIAQTIET